jgi:hypothetical protein
MAIMRLSIFFALSCATASAQYFSLPQTTTVGSRPSALASADFNGDGKADLAVIDSASDTITILLGSGNGSFAISPGGPINVGRGPCSLAIGDFNRDGIMDLAVVNSGSDDVSIFFGDNRGHFTPAPGSPFAVGVGPQSIAVGRQSPNSNVALYIANRVSGSVSVLVADRNGNFSPAPGTPILVGKEPVSIVAGSFSASAYPFTDIAVANKGDNTVTVLLQDAINGSFAPAPGSPFAVGRAPLALTVVDIDHHGEQDLIVSNAAGVFATILKGSSNGSFTALRSISLPGAVQPAAIAVADFDLDGYPDLVAVLPGENGYAVFLGNGAGGFSALTATPFPSGRSPQAIAVADFNGDGRLDVATVNTNEGAISVSLSRGLVVTPPDISLRTGAPTTSVNVIPQASASTHVTAATRQKWLSVSPNRAGAVGSSSVTAHLSAGLPPLASNSGEVMFSAPGLFPGRLQVHVAASTPSNTLSIQPGSPFPGFGNGSPITATEFVTGDFNGDSYPDVVVTTTVSSGASSHEKLTIYFGPSFTQTASFDLATTRSGTLAVGDFNRDGALDLADANGDGTLYVYLGDGHGGLSVNSPKTFVVGGQLFAMAAADLNHDGKLDLVIGTAANGIAVLLGVGDGTFSNASPSSPYAVANPVRCVAIGDFNSDGNPDIVFGTTNSIQTLVGNGQGGFSAGPPIASSSISTIQIAVADVNNDGIQDLAVSSFSGLSSSPIQSFIGDGSGGFHLVTNILPSTFVGYTIVAADLNGDGIADLATGNFTTTSVYTLNGHGGGTLSSFAASGIQLAVDDFNRDGRTDLAVLSSGVSILLGSVANTATTLNLVNPAYPGQPEGSPLGLTASVSGNGLLAPPTGSVTFYDSGNSLAVSNLDASGNAPLNGAGVLTLGTHTLSAVYNGDTGDKPSTAVSIQVPIVPGPAINLTTISGSNQRAVVGDLYVLPFKVLATDMFNVPVPNTTVTFSSPGTGAGGTMSGMSVNSDDSGIATLLYPNANNLTGTYTVSASGHSFSTTTPTTPLFSLTNIARPVGLTFVPVAPCRVADTRGAAGPFGAPSIAGQSSRDFTIPLGPCSIPANAQAYSLNVAVVPQGPLGYLTAWPAGQPQPNVATLNSDGRTKSNATIVAAGTNGAVSFFATNTTDLVIDINGYFVAPSTPSSLAFYPIAPCRVADTRKANAPLGGPFLAGQNSRTFPVQSSSCGIPSSALAYSVNFAAIPHGPLGFITAWPTGQAKPRVASLNALTGTVTANAEIVPAGSGGSFDVFASNDTDLVIDIDGYFAPRGTGGLLFYGFQPCRALDSRLPAGTAPFSGTIAVNIGLSGCATSSSARAFVLNATVVPSAALGFLTLWPQSTAQPNVATLNASDGAITGNLAIVPASFGSIDAFATSSTQLVMDVFGYFAP